MSARTLEPTSHVIRRWMERVGGCEDYRVAEARVREFLRNASLRLRPPRWAAARWDRQTNIPDSGLKTHGASHVRFACWHEQPGVVLVVKGERAITVITRDMVKRSPFATSRQRRPL